MLFSFGILKSNAELPHSICLSELDCVLLHCVTLFTRAPTGKPESSNASRSLSPKEGS